MAVPQTDVVTLLSALTAAEPARREDACGTVTDWLTAFDRFQARTIATVLASTAVAESDASCREAQLHALAELADTGHLAREFFEPVLNLAPDTLDPSEREYLEALEREVDTDQAEPVAAESYVYGD
ncbi:hypothetical protein [Streptacidiphilus anmyonensis]|uniref:hypothetical protein n=1 Tax=Streptacidiphilus anmyonensis TaxID=405782 RepID=UPI0005AAE89D|nr:hypothetical protein [Streptacidiphilus anmyonensis]